ncbi:MAG: RNA-dependent RNA polymerase [Botrytis cinerea binarnavirus 6]|nr:MAG: RNA-dependent RNA polymerase [Botrytis cinerea binarnavirus 6]
MAYFPSLTGKIPEGGGIPPPCSKLWSLSSHVLALSTFPGTTTLRNRGKKKAGTCSCKDGEIHREFFDFCKEVIVPTQKEGNPIPHIKVCWDAENLFESKLGRDITGLDTRMYFKDIKQISLANKVLFESTYWFRRLMFPKHSKSTHSRNGLAVLRLLAGLPTFSGKETVSQLSKLQVHKGSVNKLRSILATVDGLIMQLVLSFPDRGYFLSWERIDQITNCMIGLLLADYFSEKDTDLNSISTFERVKKIRGLIKRKGFLKHGDLSDIDIPRDMSFFKVALDFISDGKRPIDIYRVAILCQKRAAGVPPRSVYNKTLAKIKGVLVEECDPLVYQRVKGIIGPAVKSIHNKVLDRLGSESRIEKFWSNCLEKAKISLSDSGEFFTNSENGGKLEAARLVLSSKEDIYKYNLFTGIREGVMDKSTTPQGMLLFHWALGQFSDRENCYERNLMSVRISLVAELGKYRAITVSHLAHAVLLHVLSHVILEYLKAIPSSESGVGAANHAWNFFKRLSHKNPNANFVFSGEENYLFSTDWEQATDYCDHSVSQSILNNICLVLGIPKWYRETVVFALCAPRQVEFIDPEGKTLEAFYTTRAELMGDPVVKGILHYFHLVAREAAFTAAEGLKSLYGQGKLVL